MLLGSEAQEAANTSRVFARDLAAGRAWRMLDAADAGNQPAAARAALEAGYLVIAPPQTRPNADPYAYWRIDPVTGTTLGIGPYGAGATYGEYVGLLTNVAVTGVCFYKARGGSTAAQLGCVVASLGTLTGGIGLAAGMMEGAGSIVAAAHWATAIFTALGGVASMAD